MSKYDFFIAQLHFVVSRTDRESGDVACMMDALTEISDALEGKNEIFFVPHFRLRSTARALAGVAGLMQQHILPEVIAAQNRVGEKQVRWTIETCMTWVAKLMTHAELTKDAEGLSLSLPPLN